MDNGLDLELSFADEDAQKVLSILNQAGAADVQEVKQFGAVGIEFLVIAIIAAQALANILIKLLPLWKCGVVVDARGPRVLTKKNCDLPRGHVLVFTKDGTQYKLHHPSEFDLTALIEKALPKRP